ncbi:hypothetical protein ACJMK2_008844 [Sinanodonta woodiana]|uniref:FAD dependent oxidoreductase domain-containing protein n=1 Tax=Sinanodonta woodiana TaxID=1069815 RepID=A0ABD3VDE0_SINWO
MAPNIVVLGAGVVGLSTAVPHSGGNSWGKCHYCRRQIYQGYNSDGAAGMFRPTLLLTPAPSEDIFRRWCEDSFRWYDVISRSEESPVAGIYPISGYELSTEFKEYPYHHKMIYNFREMTPREMQSFPGNYKCGWCYTTLIIESRYYLPWMMKRFRKNGGKVINQTVKNLEEFTEKYDLLVNCSSLSSRELFGDKEMTPIRGHLIRVKAPWVKHFLIVDNADTYIYPGQDNVALGGTRQKGIEDLTHEQVHFDDVMRRCCAAIPSLKTAKIEQQWIGLRPFRSVVRVEGEEVNIKGKTLKVVHNYGHGANGVTLSWGTAVHATEIAKKMLQCARCVPSKL